MAFGIFARGLAVLVLLGAGAAQAADGDVTLVKQPKIGAAEAFPRIANPADDGAKRINTALGRQDVQLRKAAADCRSNGKGTSWDRKVTVPMAGPGFLSLIAADDYDCGGAYPSTGQMALVYDLQTGRPVNWARLLPAALAGTLALDDAADGSKIGTVDSPKLHALYQAGYPAGGDDRAACIDAVAGSAFILWPDAKAGGVVLLPSSLPHAVAGCAEPVTIRAATLKTLGVDASLTDAIDSAHQAH